MDIEKTIELRDFKALLSMNYKKVDINESTLAKLELFINEEIKMANEIENVLFMIECKADQLLPAHGCFSKHVKTSD